MKKFVTSIRNFLREEEGATAVEYGVLVALIIVACVLAILAIGTNLNNVFQTVSNCLADPSAANCTLP